MSTQTDDSALIAQVLDLEERLELATESFRESVEASQALRFSASRVVWEFMACESSFVLDAPETLISAIRDLASEIGSQTGGETDLAAIRESVLGDKFMHAKGAVTLVEDVLRGDCEASLWEEAKAWTEIMSQPTRVDRENLTRTLREVCAGIAGSSVVDDFGFGLD